VFHSIEKKKNLNSSLHPIFTIITNWPIEIPKHDSKNRSLLNLFLYNLCVYPRYYEEIILQERTTWLQHTNQTDSAHVGSEITLKDL